LKIFSPNDGNSLKTKFSPLSKRKSEKAGGYYQMRARPGWLPKNS
jgi:hypothetical protein